MKVIIVNPTKSFSSAKDIQVLLNKIYTYFLEKKIRNKAQLNNKKEITVVFLTKSEMKKLNYQFRKKNKATDVLSFDSQDANSFGELLLCPEILKIQAKQQKHSYHYELGYMLIHGFLHLLGYDHELSVNEEKIMFRLQESCFKDLILIKK